MNKHILVPVLFMALLLITGGLYFIVPDREVSDDENRRLASFPELSLSSLADGSYTAGLNDYMSDQFPLRDCFMAAGERLRSAMTLRSDVEMVLGAGNTGMGTGETLGGPVADSDKDDDVEIATAENYNGQGIIIDGSRAMELFTYSYSLVEYYASMVNGIKNALPEVNVYSLMVPTSADFYSPERYHTKNYSQKSAINDVYSMLSQYVTKVDAYSNLAKNTDRYIYFRSDHHWTARGAYQGYRAFCKAAGLKPVPEDDFTVSTVEGDFLGTLYRMTHSAAVAAEPDFVEVLEPPKIKNCTAYTAADMKEPYETDLIVDPGDATNKYLTFLGGDHPLIHIETNVKNGRSILLIKDSYGNAFAPFLVNHYENVYVMDPRSAKADLVRFCDDHDINDLIIENYTFILNNTDLVDIMRNMV